MPTCVCSQDAPSLYCEIGTGEQIREENIVEFRLLYSGQLHASNGNTRIDQKNAIRRELHPQLKRLWATNRGLIELAAHHSGAPGYRIPTTPEELELARQPINSFGATEWHREAGLRYFAKKWERCGCGFIPLVTESIVVRCAIDILFLRPEEPGKILTSGDLDNRIKTLFDALRLPKNLSECGGTAPSGEYDPMYCLLEDDQLISEVRVLTDKLLVLPKTQVVSKHDVFLVMHVKLEPQSGSEWEHVYR
jgi:hypothetical protein